MHPVRVLLVDDVSQVRQDLRLVLDLAGNIEIVAEASNGLEAVQLAETLQPEVILMDLEMPVLDGYQAAALIKSKTPACRILALTVHDYPQARSKAFASGIDAFIVKGDTLENLTQTIFKFKRNPHER